MSDLPDRCMCHNCDLVKAGILKSRDKMDIEAAAKTSGLWAPRLEEFAKTYAERVVDSAWGKKVGR